MAIQNMYINMIVAAGADLSALQYYAVAIDDGGYAVNGAEAIGILQNKPKTGEGADIGYLGTMKFRAADTIAKGDKLTVTAAGTMVLAGSGYYIVGKAWAAATSGSVGTGVFNFANPTYAFSSSFIL